MAMIESSASSELYALLKRQDEKAVTERAYENPVFVEDLVRNVALKLNAHPEVTWYKVEAENYESIHNHNAYACIEKGLRRGLSRCEGFRPAKIFENFCGIFGFLCYIPALSKGQRGSR